MASFCQTSSFFQLRPLSPSHSHRNQQCQLSRSRRRSFPTCKAVSEPVSVTPPSAPGSEYTPSSGTASMNLMTSAVNALFSFKPFFQFASATARNMIIERGTQIGYPWEPRLQELRKHDWDAELARVQASSAVKEYPSYYLQPFHAYEKGNLSMDAALEVELAAKSVHANVFDPARKVLDPEGDIRLREGYHNAMIPLLRDASHVSRIIDLGCATGLSTFALLEEFPDAREVHGVDLSPHFIAVANYNLREKNAEREGGGGGGSPLPPLPVQFKHAAAEDTGLPSGSFDLVSMCLVCHELPRHATTQIISEAFRLLRPGGAFCIMEMNPQSPLLESMVNNVFAFTAFKATEPYFDDYRTFPIEAAIAEAGFEFPDVAECSPRHKAIVAHKPVA